MRVIIRDHMRRKGSHTDRLWAICLGCVLAVGGCSTVENIGYWDRDSSESTEEETESATPTEDTATGEQASDPPDTGTGTGGDSDDTTVPSDTVDTSDTGTAPDTEDSETIDDSETSDSESDTTPEYIRVPFQPEQETSPVSFLVPPEENLPELPGIWTAYAYPFDETSNKSTMTTTNDICMSGTVGQSSGGFFPTTYAGMGVNLCPDVEYQFNWTFYSFDNCPYTQANEGYSLVGFSYYVDGDLIPNGLVLHFVWTNNLLTQSIDTGRDTPGDYLFETMFNVNDERTYPSELFAIQFQVDGSITGTVDFDFCIRDFALLITEE